jgi:ubiquinone/menaquinone biosynthesis C-methylase UbiE
MNLEDHVVKAFYEQIKCFLAPDIEVLDVGANIGRISRLVSSEVKRIVLLEPDFDALEAAKKQFSKTKTENVAFIHSTFSHMKPQQQFDIILFFLSLHHIEDIESTFAHCHSLLKNDGLLIIGEFYTENISYPFHQYEKISHNGFSLKKIQKQLCQYGFTVKKFSNFYSLIKNNRVYPLFVLIVKVHKSTEG